MAGIIQRLYNSTLGIPQQLLLRLARKMKQGDYNLFDEDGLMDGALIPFLGVFDDHENDASGRDFTDHAGKALAIDILTDPFTYAGSSLTAAAKAAKAVGQVKNLSKLRSGVRALAAEGKAATVQDLIDLGRKTTLTAEEAKHLDNLESVGDAYRATGLDELAGRAAETELALSVPLLGRAGMQVTVPTAHKSWFGLMSSGYKAMGGLALELSGARHIPVVNGLLSRLERGAEAIREGVKASANPAVHFAPDGEAGLTAAAELLNDGGQPFIARRTAEFEKTPALKHGWARRYEEMLKRKDDTDSAFLSALGFRPSKKSAVNRRKAARVLEDMTGQKDVALPQTGDAFEALIRQNQENVATAHEALRGGQLKVKVVEDLPQFLANGAARWQSFIFEKSRGAAQAFRKAFISDIPGTINEKAARAFKSAEAGNSEAVLVMAKRGMVARDLAAKAEGMDPKVYNRAINAVFEGTPSPEELNFALDAARTGGPEALEAFHQNLMSFRTRSLNSTNILLKMLRHRGVNVGRDLQNEIAGARLGATKKHIDYENFIRDGGEELIKSGRLSKERTYQLVDGEYLAFLSDEDLNGRLTSLQSKTRLSGVEELDMDAIDTELLRRQDSAFGQVERPPEFRVGPRDFSESQVRTGGGKFKQMSPLGQAYSRMAAAVGDLDDWMARMKKSGGEIRGDDYVEFLDRLGVSMAHYQAEVEDLFKQGFKSKESAGFLKHMRDIQAMALKAAHETGMVGMKGVPLGYVPRLVSGNSRRALRRLGSDMDTRGILDAALPNLGPAFKRSLDDMTVGELNDVHKYLLESEQPELAAKLGDILEVEGLRFERLESDPVLSFMNNYSQKASNRLTGGFVDDLLSDPNQTHLISGRIGGVFEIDRDGIVAGYDSISSVAPDGAGVVTLGASARELPLNRVGVVMVTDDGRETVISLQSLMDSDIQFAHVSDAAPTPGQGFALAAARGELRSVNLTSANDLMGQVGKRVILGNGKVISGLMNTVTDQYKRSSDALRVFDSVNSWIRAAQTVMRPAFHATNMISGYFQSALLGTSARNNTSGHILAGRILFGDESAKAAAAADRHLALLGEAGLVARKGGPLTIAETVRALGSGEIPAGWGDRFVDLGEGRSVNVRDLFQAAADGGLLGTFFARGFSGTSTTSEAMLELARRVEGGKKIDDLKNLGEVSELWSRFGTYMGRVLEHGDLNLAVKEAKRAMVDYSDLTRFEKGVAKRFATYYTFSRKYMPFALEQFGKSPAGVAATAHAIQGSGAITTANGRVEFKGPNDSRINLQRLNANLDAFMLAPALMERFVSPPELERMKDPPSVVSLGGVAGVVMGTDELFVRDQVPSKTSFARDLFYTTFATKWAYQGVKYATEGEEVSALDEMTKFFLPVRKVKGGFDERKMLVNNFRKLVTSLQYEANETKSQRRRKFLVDEANRLRAELDTLLKQEEI